MEFKEGSKVMFSEFYLGESVTERAVEVSNYGEATIDLGQYRIIIFHGGALEPEYDIPLSGSLGPSASYVVRYSESVGITQYDLSTPDFVTNGTWPVALVHQGNIVDVLGTIGHQLTFADGTIVRKNEYRVARFSSEPYDWITYPRADMSHLGSSSCPLSEQEILEGPKLTAEDFARPYVGEGVLGGGGAVEVSLGYVGDGDTTTFDDLPYSLIERGLDGDSFRYQNIDTPEIQHGTSINAEPWGYAAKRWNNNILRNAKHIVIQSVLNSNITETYGRLIGYVWYSNVQNPQPGDYINLNHQTILEGYSKIEFSGSKTTRMLSKGISYYDYFVDANNRGLRDGYKVFGEIDPEFAY